MSQYSFSTWVTIRSIELDILYADSPFLLHFCGYDEIKFTNTHISHLSFYNAFSGMIVKIILSVPSSNYDISQQKLDSNKKIGIKSRIDQTMEGQSRLNL